MRDTLTVHSAGAQVNACRCAMSCLRLQAQWAFDSRAIGRAITISNTTISLGLRQRDTQAEPPQEVGAAMCAYDHTCFRIK